MKIVPFSTILAETCQLVGLDITTLNDKAFNAIRDFFNRRMSMIWDREAWPDIQEYASVWPGTPMTSVVTAPIPLLLEDDSILWTESDQDLFFQTADNTIPCVITLNTRFPRIYLNDFSGNANALGTIGQSGVTVVNPFYMIDDTATAIPLGDGSYDFTYTTENNLGDDFITTITINVPWGTPNWTPELGSTLSFGGNRKPSTLIEGQLIGCFSNDPRRTTRQIRESYIIENMEDLDEIVSSNTVHLYQELYVINFQDFNRKYLIKRKQPPYVFGSKYDSASTYQQGAQVYYDPYQGNANYNPTVKTAGVFGSFWNAAASVPATTAPANSSRYWRLLEIPYIFKNYMVNGMAADFLKSEGRLEESANLDSLAEFFVQQQIDQLVRQEGQVQKMDMVYTY